MKDFTLIFIILCVAIQMSYWIISARSVKNTAVNKGGWLMRIYAIIVVVAVIFFQKQIYALIPILSFRFWSYSFMTGLTADLIVLLGLIVMIWSRKALGANWSANVTFKENHELITSGPYKHVRHPIYSGIILIVFGAFVYSATLFMFLVFILFFIGAYYKARKEEKLLIIHFPDTYLEYKKHTKSIIPFVF